MKKGGLTAKNVEEQLRRLAGNLAAVGRHFGVNRGSVWKFVHKRPKLLAIADEVRESMKDNAESALQKAVLNGEAWAVCFYLKTQARDRGYIERQERVLSGDADNPVKVEHTNRLDMEAFKKLSLDEKVAFMRQQAAGSRN